MTQETQFETKCVVCGSSLDIEESVFKICPYCNALQPFRKKETDLISRLNGVTIELEVCLE